MPWVRLDEHFPDHPKIVGLTPVARDAFVRSLCYANAYRTDGRLPDVVARRIAPANARAQLVSAGLWHRNGTGYVIHDFLDYQPSKAEVDQARAMKAAAGKKGAAARWHKP